MNMQAIKSLTIGIIEDNLLFREYLETLIKAEENMTVLWSSPDSAGGALPLCDVIIGQWESLASVCALYRSHSIENLKYLIINADPLQLNVLECIYSGVVGFALKDTQFRDLATAIRSVAENRWVVPESILVRLLEQLLSNTDANSCNLPDEVRLTNREAQILPMIVEGLTNKEIANKLHIAEFTVKSHVHNILSKFMVERRIDLVNGARKIIRTGTAKPQGTSDVNSSREGL